MTSKWCEIECKLVLITTRRSHYGLSLGNKIGDLGRRNDRYLAFFSPNLWADYVKVVEDRSIQSVTEM